MITTTMLAGVGGLVSSWVGVAFLLMGDEVLAGAFAGLALAFMAAGVAAWWLAPLPEDVDRTP